MSPLPMVRIFLMPEDEVDFLGEEVSEAELDPELENDPTVAEMKREGPTIAGVYSRRAHTYRLLVADTDRAPFVLSQLLAIALTDRRLHGNEKGYTDVCIRLMDGDSFVQEIRGDLSGDEAGQCPRDARILQTAISQLPLTDQELEVLSSIFGLAEVATEVEGARRGIRVFNAGNSFAGMVVAGLRKMPTTPIEMADGEVRAGRAMVGSEQETLDWFQQVIEGVRERPQ